MKKLTHQTMLSTLLLCSISLFGCGESEKKPVEKAAAQSQSAPAATPVQTQPQGQSASDNVATAQQNQKGNYRMLVKLHAFNTVQDLAVDHVKLPANQNEFCHNRDYIQSNLPEGSRVKSCQFSGKTGHAEFEFKIGEQKVETSADYTFEPM